MSRAPVFKTVKQALRIACAADRSGLSVDAYTERAIDALAVDRRGFLKAAAGSAALAALPACSKKSGGRSGQVAIVGAGLAGLHCAYRLKKAGVDAAVFEAGTRLGGRVFTSHKTLPGNLIAEYGGEFIDSNHATIQMLAKELNEPLDDLAGGDAATLTQRTFYFNGRVWTMMELAQDFMPIASALSDIATASAASPMALAMNDQTTMGEWLGSRPGTEHEFQKILRYAYTAEMGLDASDQSLFNLIDTIDYKTTDPFRIFGESDQRYHLHNGSDVLVTHLSAAVSNQIETSMVLTAIAKTSSGYNLTFAKDNGTSEIDTFTHVVLAIPFSTLAEVDLTNAGISADKLNIIKTLGYGTGAKIFGAFSSRPWRDMHMASGYAFTDLGTSMLSPGILWDASIGQGGSLGLITNLLGGSDAMKADSGTPEQAFTAQLPLFDEVFPGTKAAYMANTADRQAWFAEAYERGSVACYRSGQRAFLGQEGKREGNIHFCGEHTATMFRGTMEAACATGAAAAMEVLADLHG
jgi:monoamine oxidase